MKLPLPDYGKPIKVGDLSFVYRGVYHPILWNGEDPYRPRVETLVVNPTGTSIFLRRYEPSPDHKYNYRIPGGSLDNDSDKLTQAKNETNEEALLDISNITYTNIQYFEQYPEGFLLKNGDIPIMYKGTFNDVYIAKYRRKFDKSKIDEHDLDDDMANNGKFYKILDVYKDLRPEHVDALLTSPFVSDLVKRYIRLSETKQVNVFKSNIPTSNKFVGIHEMVDIHSLTPVPKNVKLFHGSPTQDIKELKAFHDDRLYPEFGPVVFVSPYKQFAACYGTRWDDTTMKQYVTNTNDGVNVRISLLDDVQDWNHPCSLYELENDGSLYYLPGHPCEVIGKGPFKVKREERFKTFWDIVKEYNVSVQDQRTGQPVSVMINSEDHMDPKLLSERKVLREGGFYDKDGIWNSIVTIDGELYRGRVETLVFRDGSLYIQLVNKKENDNGTKYRIPGGSLERGVPNQEQAHAECMEEARLLIKNCKFSGVTYNEITGMPKWAKAIDPPVEWVGKHTEVYYAEFDKLYTGYIKKKDREEAMLRDGKFLPIEDVYNILIPEHQKVVDMYIGSKYGSISQESKDFDESYVSESFDSKAYNDYMMNGTSDYLERSYKSMKYTFIPIIGLPAFINVDDLEDTVDEIGRDVLDKYWKHNKGTKANVYQPFKCYNTLHLKNDDLMNYIYNDANPLERLKIKLYHYNFSRQGRRYSILLITVKNQLKSTYFITNTGELQPIDSAIRESSVWCEESATVSKLYHLSQSNLDGKVLTPRIPSNFLVNNGYEDGKTKRICLSNSIDGCLRGMSQNLKGMKLYIHIPEKECNVYHPTTKEVPDCKVTGEIWVKKPVKLKCIGLIKVTGDRGEDGIPYTYGDDNVAELYDWDYKWIDRYDNEVITEATKSTIDNNYKPKGKKNLSSFKKVHITETVIDKYKKEYPFLKHVRCKDTKEYICDGYIWFNNNELVAMVGSCQYTDDKTKWIVSLEITKDYKGYGLSKQILDYAVKTMNCKYLSVNKNNKIAKKVYDGYGFKVYQEDNTMYYMTIDRNIKESYIEESSKYPDEVPQEIIDFLKELNSYDYGYVKDGRKIKGMKNFFEDYKSLTISEFEKYKIGVCWDYVHYEANWFKQHKYKYETFYIQVQDEDNDCPSHTYLVFYLPNSSKVYYFESSWGKYQGIEVFDNINQLHDRIKDRHISDAESKCDPKSYFRENYNAESTSWEHLSCGDYMSKVSKGRIKIEESSNESYYRITYEDIGIYEALRNNVTDEEWKSILNSDRIKWLPKPPNYEFNNRSYFTKLGYDTFTKKALPLMKKYLDPKKIKVESFNTLDGDIVYNDEYQVVIATSVTESYVSEGFINQLVMSAPVKAYNIKNKTPINDMSDLIKYHKNPGLINYVNKCDDIEDLKYIKEDTNTITPSVKIIKERITLCKQMGDCDKTASYYKYIKRKYIDVGITERDCDATIQWVKDFNKVINIKVCKLGKDVMK